MMNHRTFLNIALFVAMVVMLSSCELVGDIFEAGVWTGVIMIVLLVVLVVGGISWLFKRMR